MTTNFQENLCRFISEYIQSHNSSPSFSEITEAMAISPRSKSLITRSLRTLAKEGRLVLTKQGRNLHISLASKQLLFLGRISAGMPIEAVAQPEFIDIAELIQGENRFVLRVKGDSMRDENIFDGDLIICRHATTANEGDIVVALIDQYNTTLKRISYKVQGMVTLIPANPELKPKAYQPGRIQIQGVYIGLIRLNS